jgi:hypothetical protein
MNALRAVVVGLAVAVSSFVGSGGSALAANSNSAALDYEGTAVVTYSIISAWPHKYTGAQPR